MRALILAAGRGERMRPLTDTTPKPLLRVGGRPIIEWQVARLAQAGFADIVVNHSHLGAMIEQALGDGARLGARIREIAADFEDHAAHLVLVDNPAWHAQGDMALERGRVRREGSRLTYGNIGVFHPHLFGGIAPGTWLKLFPWAYRFVDEGRVSGERHAGAWDNVGTPDQLAALDRRLST